MEQSKLISSVIAKLRIAYPYYFKELDEDMLIGLVKMYQDQIVGYAPQVVMKAIDEIIKRSKFMPTIAEILEECEKNKMSYKIAIIEKMKLDGYFKDSREIEKTYHFIENGVIPYWLLNDMKKYGYIDYEALDNSNKNIKQIGSVINETI